MKIIEQTNSRLVLRQKPQALFFMLIWASLFAGMPLVLIINLLWAAGVTRLECRRLPTQVDCHLQQSRWLGLAAGKQTAIPQTQAAVINSETRSNEGDYYEVYAATLISPQGNVNVTEFESNAALATDWTAQINQFLQSQQLNQMHLSLSRDSRWQGGKLLPIPFLSLFVLIGLSVLYFTIRVQTLILDKALNRLTDRVWTIFGVKQQDHPLGIVTDIQIKQHIDSYGNKYYEPILLPDAVRRVTFAHISDRQQALHIQEQIRSFLALPTPTSLPDATVLSEVADFEGIEVYRSHDRIYTTSGSTEVAASTNSKLLAMDQQLIRLGFTFIGDLQASSFPTITLYTYALAHRDVYAVIMSANTQNILIGLDFFTSFFNGTTLTTTSNRLIISHLKSQRIWRWSHPGLDPVQLYQQHQQHLLNLQAGRTQHAKTSLPTIAALIDDYYHRQTTGWLPKLATVLNGIAMATQVKKSS